MRMAVVAVVILVLTSGDPSSCVAWSMVVAPEASAITRTVTGRARRPRLGRIFAVTDSPRRAVGPTVRAVMRIVDVPRRRAWQRVVRRSDLFE